MSVWNKLLQIAESKINESAREESDKPIDVMGHKVYLYFSHGTDNYQYYNKPNAPFPEKPSAKMKTDLSSRSKSIAPDDKHLIVIPVTSDGIVKNMDIAASDFRRGIEFLKAGKGQVWYSAIDGSTTPYAMSLAENSVNEEAENDNSLKIVKNGNDWKADPKHWQNTSTMSLRADVKKRGTSPLIVRTNGATVFIPVSIKATRVCEAILDDESIAMGSTTGFSITPELVNKKVDELTQSYYQKVPAYGDNKSHKRWGTVKGKV